MLPSELWCDATKPIVVRKYIVQKGDSLSEIAAEHIGRPIYPKNGSLKKILELNDKLNTTDPIFPGDVLDIPVLPDNKITLAKPSPRPEANIQLQQPNIIESNLSLTPKPTETETIIIDPNLQEQKPTQPQNMSEPTPANKQTFKSRYKPSIEAGFFRIDSTDSATGANLIVASEMNYRFRLNYQLYKDTTWNLHLVGGIATDFISNKNSTTRALTNESGYRREFYFGTGLQLGPNLETNFDIGFEDHDFFYTTSATSPISVERILIPNIRLDQEYFFFHRPTFRIGVKALESYLMSASGTNYTILNGSMFGLGTIVKFALKNFQVSAELLVEQTNQNTSVATQKETNLWMGLSAYWGFN